MCKTRNIYNRMKMYRDEKKKIKQTKNKNKTGLQRMILLIVISQRETLWFLELSISFDSILFEISVML